MKEPSRAVKPSTLEIRGLNLGLGRFSLRDISLSADRGDYLVILGPTGSGKSVLLETIVGIHRPDSGSIRLEGIDILSHPPERRRVGFVPQDYALFPTMTVFDNLAYGLAARQLSRDNITAAVRWMADFLGVNDLLDRFPSRLSGGEKQRVALGRALVTDPAIVLLDEPLSALHEELRSDLTQGLKKAHERFGCVFVHVCHNFEEAADLATRVALIRDGAVEQEATIEELMDRPASAFAARFTRTRNLLRAKATRSDDTSRLTFEGGLVLRSAYAADGQVLAAIRPEHIRILHQAPPRTPPVRPKVSTDSDRVDHDAASCVNTFKAHVKTVRLKPMYVLVELESPLKLEVYLARSEPRPSGGDTLTVHIPPCRIYPLPDR